MRKEGKGLPVLLEDGKREGGGMQAGEERWMDDDDDDNRCAASLLEGTAVGLLVLRRTLGAWVEMIVGWMVMMMMRLVDGGGGS